MWIAIEGIAFSKVIGVRCDLSNISAILKMLIILKLKLIIQENGMDTPIIAVLIGYVGKHDGFSVPELINVLNCLFKLYVLS